MAPKRNRNPETSVKCHKCDKYTDSIEPIIKKFTGDRYDISCQCKDCGNNKHKFLNIDHVKLLPPEIRNAPANTTFILEISRNGGMIPLALLIPLITSAISVLPEIYNAVKGTTAKGSGLASELSNKDLIQLLKNRIDEGTLTIVDLCEGLKIFYVS